MKSMRRNPTIVASFILARSVGCMCTCDVLLSQMLSHQSQDSFLVRFFLCSPLSLSLFLLIHSLVSVADECVCVCKGWDEWTHKLELRLWLFLFLSYFSSRAIFSFGFRWLRLIDVDDNKRIYFSEEWKRKKKKILEKMYWNAHTLTNQTKQWPQTINE